MLVNDEEGFFEREGGEDSAFGWDVGSEFGGSGRLEVLGDELFESGKDVGIALLQGE